jgi:tetratricopeptide (TPR) repeat protein
MAGTLTVVEELEERIDALEEAGDYNGAIAALHELQERTGEDQRWHVAWMHVRAGRRNEADELWQELRAERPDDPGVPYLEACAHLEGDEDERALPLLEEALAMALRVGSDVTMVRQIAEDRTAALRRAGTPPTEVDRAARDALERTAVAVGWLAAEEHARALETWPSFAEETEGATHAAYALALDRRMRANGRRPVLVTLSIDEIEAWAIAHGWEPGWGITHAQVAAEASRAGRGAPWPPGRNEPCWCGSGAKYKKCCGR